MINTMTSLPVGSLIITSLAINRLIFIVVFFELNRKRIATSHNCKEPSHLAALHMHAGLAYGVYLCMCLCFVSKTEF